MNEKLFFHEKEAKEHGNNVHIRVFIVRHADASTPERLLTDLGRKQALLYGQEELAPKRVGERMAIRISPAIRTLQTVQTAEEAISTSNQRDDFRRRKRLSLSLVGDRFETISSPAEQARYRKLASAGQEDEYYESWFAAGESQPDEQTMSPNQVGGRMTQLLDRYAHMPEKLYSGTKLDILNGTHGQVIESLLWSVARDQIERDPPNPQGTTFLQKIGGGFKNAEGYYFDIKREQGETEVELNVRGKIYKINPGQIHLAAQEYRHKKKALLERSEINSQDS